MDQSIMIAELRERVNGHDEAIEKLDDRVTRHDEIIAALREANAKVATKDDVTALRNDINTTFFQQLKDAHSSIPGKIGLLLSAGSLLVAVIAVVASIAHHG